MDFYSDNQGILRALQDFLVLHGAALSEELRDRLLSALASPSVVDRIVNAAEALYAARAELDDAGKTITAQLFEFATMNGGWHGLHIDNRGVRILNAMRRDLGEPCPSGEWPAADTDPATAPQFAPEPEADAPLPVELPDGEAEGPAS